MLPFALLTLVVLDVLAAPFENAVSRRYEAEADWSALKATHDPRSARKLFVDFQKTSLQEPNPSLARLPLAREPPDDRAADRDGRGVGRTRR